jgi:hypothetical protein
MGQKTVKGVVFMFKRKKIVGIFIAALLVVSFAGGVMAVYAANADGKGNGYINEQEDAALTAAKQNGGIPLDANGNPAAPGGRGSRMR